MRQLTDTPVQTIALVAPAGHGKTVLARQWLASGPDAAWFGVRRPFSDVAAAVAELANVVDPARAGVGAQIHHRLRTLADPLVELAVFAELLCTELAEWRERWLVIDDYHILMESPSTEELIEEVLRQSNVPLLLTSRRRPSWITARQILYGEVVEIGRSALAMTPEEAALVLEANNAQTLPGLVSIAEGWPAVIGLAALVDPKGSLPEGEFAEELHTYFADELYAEPAPTVRASLRDLALAPIITGGLIDAAFGHIANVLKSEATRLGFVTRAESENTFEMHPLLRSFLLRKREEEPCTSQATAVIRAMTEFYVGSGMWDEAFLLAGRLNSGELLVETLTNALDALLANGRIQTLEEWVRVVRAAVPDAAICALADAEIAFRRGHLEEAATIASALTKRLSPDDLLFSKALRRAAQSFHLSDRCETALDLFGRARETARTSQDRRQALWGEIVTALEIDRFDEADQSIASFLKLNQSSPEDGLRQAQARMMRAIRTGDHVDRALDETKPALSLLDDATDPLVLTAFMSIVGSAFCLTASYEHGLDLAERQQSVAAKAGLSFVLPHSLVLYATALVGLRRFTDAARTLDAAFGAATIQRDAYSRLNAGALYARLHLANRRPERALQIIRSLERPETPTKGMLGELLATYALTLACSKEVEEARIQAGAAAELHAGADSRVLNGFAKFIADHYEFGHEDPRTLRSFAAATAEVDATGTLDSFVCVYRAFPELLTRYKLASVLEGRLIEVVRSRDPRLASSLGITSPPITHDEDALTERERQVLMLIYAGMVNREIAQALWISESTAKVHIRHIFKKLGVRSRTAAAVRARELGIV